MCCLNESCLFTIKSIKMPGSKMINTITIPKRRCLRIRCRWGKCCLTLPAENESEESRRGWSSEVSYISVGWNRLLLSFRSFSASSRALLLYCPSPTRPDVALTFEALKPSLKELLSSWCICVDFEAVQQNDDKRVVKPRLEHRGCSERALRVVGRWRATVNYKLS